MIGLLFTQCLNACFSHSPSRISLLLSILTRMHQ